MTPATQAVLHDPENGKVGDCFRATIASLLDMPTEAVPHFIEDGLPGPGWQQRLNAWLAQFDLAFIEFMAGDVAGMKAHMKEIGFDAFTALCGPSPRFVDSLHSVVGHCLDVVHDPHPDRSCLAGEPETFGFLVKRCATVTWESRHAEELDRWAERVKRGICELARIALYETEMALAISEGRGHLIRRGITLEPWTPLYSMKRPLGEAQGYGPPFDPWWPK